MSVINAHPCIVPQRTLVSHKFAVHQIADGGNTDVWRWNPASGAPFPFDFGAVVPEAASITVQEWSYNQNYLGDFLPSDQNYEWKLQLKAKFATGLGPDQVIFDYGQLVGYPGEFYVGRVFLVPPGPKGVNVVGLYFSLSSNGGNVAIDVGDPCVMYFD